MALKRLRNGMFKITSLKQAEEAYALMQELSDSVLELEKENGITEMRQDAVNLKLSADEFLIAKEKDDLEIAKIGKRAKVIRGFEGIWVETKRDALSRNLPAGVRNLKSIVGSEVWKKITSRRLDPDKLQEAVATGLVDEKEIEQAYYEKPRAPYVRLYDSEDE